RSSVRVGAFSGLLGASMTFSAHALLVLAVCVGALFALHGELTVGALFAFFEILWWVTSAIQQIAAQVTPLQEAAAGMQHVRELLQQPATHADRPGAQPLPPFGREIRVTAASV